ncbi:mrna guanylyltransferase [Moniliophthora roreri]|uniref:mRNA-capping enzyme subunit alpha n=1 Tax=Moniliophthora roreri TaxID=221103 RepID=A0A0W0FL60_MONRR|nr:mrna guanylyltransferase [Moniliophthora roreri]
MSKIPDLPGTPITQYEQEAWLKDQVRALCGLDNLRFPGAQPVSFGMKDLLRLESQDFWVCEKSDGIRVLLLVHTNLSTAEQCVYIIDRHNTYRILEGLFFPHHENPINPLRSTIVDGELVVDTDPITQRETLRFLVFDCLVVDNQNVMNRPLDKRYGRLTEWFYKPYSKMIKDHPHMLNTQPFEIKVKLIQAAYHAEQIFNVDIPKLQHGNDGLIYTCVNAPYSPGTDQNMQWKPPTENSIDFKLVLRFPPLVSDPNKPDLVAKPVFLLKVWCGDQRYEQYDEMYVEDDEWEKMKLSGEQYDDRIIEVHWDPNVSHWRMMRFRDDKPNGNHLSIVEKIIDSIADGVDKDTLLSRCNAIRVAWKTRQGQPVTQEPQNTTRSVPNPPPKRPFYSIPHAEIRFGPIQSSPWSKVSGPEIVAGFQR